MLEIHLLGSIELRRDGELVRLGGCRQRRLLAFLALQPGRVRTMDSICGALWPDGDLPADPHQTVRTYASRLRSSLGEPEAITMRDGGYELSVDGVLIDAKRFEALVSTANDPSCPLDESVALLDEALSLWAGPALDGFELEDWARPDAVQLEELRAQAIDDRAEAQLELGRPDEAVAALPRRRRRQPLAGTDAPAAHGRPPPVRPAGRGVARLPGLPPAPRDGPRPGTGREDPSAGGGDRHRCAPARCRA